MAVRLAFFYAAFFLYGGMLLPFWPLWLEARGLGPAQIGAMLALSQCVKVVAGPTGGWLADRWAQRRTPIILLSGLTLTGLWLYHPAHGVAAIAAVTILVTACQAPIMPLGENLALMTMRQHGLDYGRIRLWGSVTFIAGGMAIGALLVGRPPDLVLLLGIAAFGLIFVAAVSLPDTRPQATSGVPRASPIWLLRRPAFLLVLLAGSLVQSSHAVLYGFSTLHWTSHGIDSFTIAVLWAIGVVAEILLFAFGGRVVARMGSGWLFALAGAAGVLRWIVSGLTVSPYVLAPAQALHALTFGAAHLGAMQFLSRAIPPQLSATAQSLYSAIAVGGTYGLVMWLSGGLYASWGGSAFHVMAAMSAAGLVAGVLLARRWKGEMLS
jgi:MFS transporter, PPP family, 3-phenylpropionic acid transporter